MLQRNIGKKFSMKTSKSNWYNLDLLYKFKRFTSQRKNIDFIFLDKINNAFYDKINK